MNPEDGLLNALGVQLVLVGELRDHHVVGVESTFLKEICPRGNNKVIIYFLIS